MGADAVPGWTEAKKIQAHGKSRRGTEITGNKCASKGSRNDCQLSDANHYFFINLFDDKRRTVDPATGVEMFRALIASPQEAKTRHCQLAAMRAIAIFSWRWRSNPSISANYLTDAFPVCGFLSMLTRAIRRPFICVQRAICSNLARLASVEGDDGNASQK